jgi:hypothetical protein
VRRIRGTPLTDAERKRFLAAVYAGSPLHKRNPGDFGLTPPADPRPDKTLCDEAGIHSRAEAGRLFRLGMERGLVSVATAGDGLPKQFWAVAEDGRVFEAMYGGTGAYHGYPIRRSDPFSEVVTRAWRAG